MIKFFIILIFLAEVVLALAVIAKIVQADKFVVSFDKLISSKKGLISPVFISVREFLDELYIGVTEFTNLIKQKRQDYIFAFSKTMLSYSLILLLRGKYRKMFLTYQLAKEIYEGCLEA